MAKHLGRVPIAGSVVEAHGLRFEAEAPAGPPQPDRHRAGERAVGAGRATPAGQRALP